MQEPSKGGLTDVERARLLDAAKRIYDNKLVQAKGFGMLASKAEDEKIRQLLLRISNDESGHAQFWFERIEELEEKSGGSDETPSGGWKEDFMMRILGTKGFFEWTVIGEEEAIHDLAIRAENIENTTASQAWIRTASDERLHLERMKTEVLGMEAWEIRGGGGVRDVIFGLNDGLVSTLAFVAGIVGATANPSIVLLSGAAEIIAGIISLAIGSYQSAKSELEVLDRESRGKQTHKGKTAEEQKEELTRFYQSEGFKRGEAEAMVDRIAEQSGEPLQVGTLEKLGLAPKQHGDPGQEGLLSGLSYGLAALIPILPFALPLGVREALIASIVCTVVSLFVVGAMKTIFSRKNWVRSGLEMMAIGAFAAAATYVIGTLFSMII